MWSETLTGCANIGVLAVLAAMSAVKLRKNGGAVFALTTAGAALFLAHWALCTFAAGDTFYPGAAGFLQLAALLVLFSAVMSEDKGAGPRTIVMIALPAMMFLTAALFVYIFIPQTRNILDIQGFPFGALFLSLFALLTALTRPIPSPHYCAQGFLFLSISSGITIYASLYGTAPWTAAASGAAAVFAFISLALYIDAVASEKEEPGLTPVSDSSAAKNDVCAEIARGLKNLDPSVSREEWLACGLDVVARALRDNMGYNHVSVVMQGSENDAIIQAYGGLMRNTDGLHETQVFIATELFRRLIERQEVIVSGSLRDDIRLSGCSFEALEWNSAALVPIPSRAGGPACILIVGDRADGLSMQNSDHQALSNLRDYFSIFFSYLLTRNELYVSANLDPVTLQLNYSSFQRILSRKMHETDKNGGAFALALFDVDKFFILNEKLGYERGDQVLRELGASIRQFADDGFVGRVGADELAIILSGDVDTVRSKIDNILEQIGGAASEICPEMHVSLSVAYTMYPYDFLEQASVLSKIRETLAAGSSTMGQLLRVKCT